MVAITSAVGLAEAGFEVTFDRAFLQVMQGCAARSSTWITRDIFRVYSELHAMQQAHSVEVWVDGELAGGLYGVHIGGAFFAESKFHRVIRKFRPSVLPDTPLPAPSSQ